MSPGYNRGVELVNMPGTRTKPTNWRRMCAGVRDAQGDWLVVFLTEKTVGEFPTANFIKGEICTS
jgi:hypothetical protein